ncbi:MAG: prolyl oligopeptidase family serine peptidase [candidate division Zixibacteria bacterium]|nr:prolyl oligopeptidase family serine peptidase [candidate division Zixibacteria bacterium]
MTRRAGIWGGAALLCVCALSVCGCGTERLKPPATAMVPTNNIYHGVTVVDNYQWLENAGDTAVQKWSEEQTRYARQYLDNIPVRAAIAGRLSQLYKEASPTYGGFQFQNGRLFALKNDPTKDQSMLVVMDSPHDLSTVKVVLDPNQLDPSGRTAIDFFAVSLDARLVAVSLSQGGTEDGDVHVYQLATGEALPDVVPRVNGPTAGGDVAWKADGSGFFYTRYPRKGEKPTDSLRFYQQVYFHVLGTPTEQDIYVIGEQFPVIAEVKFRTSPDSKDIIAQVANGDGGEFAHYLLEPSGEWKQITHQEDGISNIEFGPDNSLYLLSHKNAPRGKILHLAAGRTDLEEAQAVIPESDVVIDAFVVTENRIFVCDVVGGPSKIRVLDREGTFQKTVPILPVSAVDGLVGMGGDKVLFRNQNHTTPDAVYTFEPSEGSPMKTAMQTVSPADFSDVEVIRDFATSKDGTRVPISIMRRKGTVLDGRNPTVLYGYGGYGMIQRPTYDRNISLWLDQGGVYVKANIRGGGEFGEDWHKAGYLTKKQNVFDDFAACAQYLIDKKYTNPSKLAIRGGSNGGLLVGAVMMQHPEMFKAVVCEKGVLDMLRVELGPNGAFNVTEYGTVKNPEQFRAMRAYSPYNNIVNGTKYPDVYFTADENDNRVLSFHSKKTTAALQAASPGSLTLLAATKGRGHAIGSSLSDDIAVYTDVYSFLFDRLGVEYRQPAR